MSQDVFVAGVGMIPFTKPGASEPYPRWAPRPRARRWPTPASATSRSSRPTSATSTATRPRPDGALRGRHDRHPDRQRQQQLLDRLDRAVPGAPGGGTAARPTACWRSASSRCSPGALGARVQRPARARSSASTRSPTSWSATARCRWRCATSAAPASRTCRSTARKLETFAKIRAKASRHAANNPLALFRKVVTEEEVMNAPVIWPGVMTRLMACPPTCGAAAAIIVLGGLRQAARPAHRRAHRWRRR